MKPDERAAAGARRAPQGGWGNAEPPVHIRRTNGLGLISTPLAWVLWNGNVTRAKNAYAAHEFGTHAQHSACTTCELRTRRRSGLCKSCEEESA